MHFARCNGQISPYSAASYAPTSSHTLEKHNGLAAQSTARHCGELSLPQTAYNLKRKSSK